MSYFGYKFSSCLIDIIYCITINKIYTLISFQGVFFISFHLNIHKMRPKKVTGHNMDQEL